jgi:hypothetical protein
MTIVMILSGIAVSGLSLSSHHARQTSREMIKTHLQQARAHAIATRAMTALIIPVRDSGKKALQAISFIEVERIDGEYEPLKDGSGGAAPLQRWVDLPQNFHFVTSRMIKSDLPTAVDYEKTLSIFQRGHEMECHMIVFAPNGQICYPPSGEPIRIAMAHVVRNGNSFRISQMSNQEPVFDLLLVNRLTARARSITP